MALDTQAVEDQDAHQHRKHRIPVHKCQVRLISTPATRKAKDTAMGDAGTSSLLILWSLDTSSSVWKGAAPKGPKPKDSQLEMPEEETVTTRKRAASTAQKSGRDKAAKKNHSPPGMCIFIRPRITSDIFAFRA